MTKYVFLYFGLCFVALSQTGTVTPLGPEGGIISILKGSLNDEIIIAVAAEDKVYRTVDGGETWNRVLIPVVNQAEHLSVRDIAIHPAASDTIFMTTSQGLLRSTNKGIFWEYIQSFPSPRNSIKYAPGNSAVMIGSDEFGVLRSTNGGISWTPLKDNIFFGNRFVRHVAVHPADTDPATMRIVATTGFEDTTGIFLTSNGGITWQPFIKGLPLGDARRIYAAEFDSTGLGRTDYRVFIGTADGLYALQTDQAAATWQAIRRNDVQLNGIITGGILVYDKFDTVSTKHRFDFFIAANGSEFEEAPKQHTNGNGIFKIGSLFGTIITILPTSPPPITRIFDKLCNINSIFVPTLSNKQKIYVGTTNGIFISSDGGQTWQKKNNGISHVEVRNLISVPANLANSKVLIAANFGGGALRSTDDGISWNESNTGITNPFVTAVVADHQRNILYTGTVFTLFRSNDAGKTWNKIFSVDSTAVKNSSRFKTMTNDMTVRISPIDPDVIMFRASAYGLNISTNGGVTWSHESPPNGVDTNHVTENIAFDPINASTIYYTGVGIHKSTDLGKTWIDISSNLPKSIFAGGVIGNINIDVLSPTVHPKNSDEIFVATVYANKEGMPYRIFRTSNGGQSWNGADTAIRAFDLLFDKIDPKRIITSGPGGIFQSTNSGSNWSRISNQSTTGSYYLIDPHAVRTNVFFAGSNHGATKIELSDISRLSVDSLGYYFGSLRVGQDSIKTIFLRNTNGTRNVVVRFDLLSDTSSYKYNGKVEYDIPAGGSVSFNVQYVPTTGGYRNAFLRFTTSDNLLDTVRILLLGHAYVRSTVEKFTFDFGSVLVGKDSTIAITIDNQFGLSSFSLTYLGQTDSTIFKYLGNKGLVIDTGKSSPIQFTFRPRSAGIFQTTVYFSTNDQKLPSVQLKLFGTGVVLNTLKRKILIDTGVGFVANNGANIQEYFNFLIRSLERAKIDIDFTKNGPSSQYSAMLFFLPNGSPPSEFIDTLQAYILNGGTVVSAGDFGIKNNLPFNTFLHDTTWAKHKVRTGIRYNSNLIADATVTDTALAGISVAFPYRTTSITTNVDSVILFASGSLSIDTSVSNVAPLLIARSPLLISVNPVDSSFAPILSAVVAAVSNIGKGKIVALADYDMWWNGISEDSLRRFGIFTAKNLQFALNIFGSADNFTVVLPEPTPQEAYRMISIPYSFEDSSVVALFKDLGQPNNLVWRMFGKWNDKNGYSELPKDFRNIRRGEGYFLITKKPINVSFGSTSVQGSEEDFEISLHPGFNMIGNPFPYTVSWANSFREDSTIERVLWKYDRGFDTTSQLMEPFFGYFVKNRSDKTKKIRINSSPITSLSILPKNEYVSQDLKPNEWKMQVVAQSPHTTDQLNYLGILESATNDLDIEDFSEPPPSPSNFISLYFLNSKGRLSADYRSFTTEGQYWDMEIASSYTNVPISVTLLNFGKIPNNFGIFLLDIVKERVYDITESLKYLTSFEKNESRRQYRILIGTEKFIQANIEGIPIIPLEYLLSQNYPNPFNPNTTIRYAVANSGRVSLEIFNILGQKVRTLVQENLKIGQYSTDWDGTNDARIPVASGIYYYRITTSKFTATKMMTLVK